MRPLDAALASLVALAIVAAVVTGHGTTAAALTAMFNALATAVKTTMQPLGSSPNTPTAATTATTATPPAANSPRLGWGGMPIMPGPLFTGN